MIILNLGGATPSISGVICSQCGRDTLDPAVLCRRGKFGWVCDEPGAA